MTNRLIYETSPYLLQHAENPVDWYAWGEEAFQHARSENKPIFLSIGYAACHWCHVMAHESFEDPEIAAIMNDRFINIKVDREERPDIDSIYMDAVVALSGQGGWPMSVFLTHELQPFFGGTYFPPSRRYNMPAFRDVLEQISVLWEKEPDRALNIGRELSNHLSQSQAQMVNAHVWGESALKTSLENLFQHYDWKHGGWGGPPKFPNPIAIEALLNIYQREGNVLARDLATHALDSMVSGGMYDQIGGGFHRYAVDADWLVPHFEKMLYDNACLMRIYHQAWKISGNARYLEIVEQTYDFLTREMRSPEGGFYSSLDADSEGTEGTYYTWTHDEVVSAIDDPGLKVLAELAYSVTPLGNFEGRNVLSFRSTRDKLAHEREISHEVLDQELQIVRSRLLVRRAGRIRPATDDKIIAAWNGMLLLALSESAGGTGRADILNSAQDLADFLLEKLVVEGELRRTWRSGKVGAHAFLEDYASLGLGLLALYGVDFQARWYHTALGFADLILARFKDPDGGFFDTPGGQSDLITRPRSTQDTPIPSASSMATHLLLQLYALTGEAKYRDSAEAALASMVKVTYEHPTAFAGWLDAFERNRRPPLQLAIIGDPLSAGFRELTRVAYERNHPDLVLAGGPPSGEGSPNLAEGRAMLSGQATAYLCRGFRCDLPTSDPAQLSLQLLTID